MKSLRCLHVNRTIEVLWNEDDLVQSSFLYEHELASKGFRLKYVAKKSRSVRLCSQKISRWSTSRYSENANRPKCKDSYLWEPRNQGRGGNYNDHSSFLFPPSPPRLSRSLVCPAPFLAATSPHVYPIVSPCHHPPPYRHLQGWRLSGTLLTGLGLSCKSRIIDGPSENTISKFCVC